MNTGGLSEITRYSEHDCLPDLPPLWPNGLNSHPGCGKLDNMLLYLSKNSLKYMYGFQQISYLQ
jgi:hypothetical protein